VAEHADEETEPEEDVEDLQELLETVWTFIAQAWQIDLGQKG
jgi:hypothetical protein